MPDLEWILTCGATQKSNPYPKDSPRHPDLYPHFHHDAALCHCTGHSIANRGYETVGNHSKVAIKGEGRTWMYLCAWGGHESLQKLGSICFWKIFCSNVSTYLISTSVLSFGPDQLSLPMLITWNVGWVISHGETPGIWLYLILGLMVQGLSCWSIMIIDAITPTYSTDYRFQSSERPEEANHSWRRLETVVQNSGPRQITAVGEYNLKLYVSLKYFASSLSGMFPAFQSPSPYINIC